MNRYVLVGLAAFSICRPAPGQELLRTYTLQTAGSVHVTTDLIVKEAGLEDFLYTPVPGSELGSISAMDVSKGKALDVRVKKAHASIALPQPISGKAEFRLRIEEQAPSDGLTMHRTLEKGRYLFILPAGYGLKACSLPAQVKTTGDQVSVGIVQANEVPASLDLAFTKETGVKSAAFDASFTALDNRIVSYDLLEPQEHRIRLWLEMYVDHPGQSHFYSQLRIEDQTSEPITLDVDRGVELPTRIISGKEANAIGDSPSPFKDDARVLVADLGYSIPVNGSARLRSFQTATDPQGYRTTGPDEFRLDRFIARTRTQYILPAGWALTSMDQPGAISANANGRTVIDFTGIDGHASRLTIIGHRSKAGEIQTRGTQ